VAYFSSVGIATSDSSFTYSGNTLNMNGTATRTDTLLTATTNAVIVSSPSQQFNNTQRITTEPYQIASIALGNLTQYDSLLLAGNFASAYYGETDWNPPAPSSPTIFLTSFFLGYQVDNIAAVFDPGYANAFSLIQPQVSGFPAQGAKTIFKILRKGIDYTVGASRIYLVVAGTSYASGWFLNNYDYTLALIPVV
jgi:hypothetical protein